MKPGGRCHFVAVVPGEGNDLSRPEWVVKCEKPATTHIPTSRGSIPLCQEHADEVRADLLGSQLGRVMPKPPQC